MTTSAPSPAPDDDAFEQLGLEPRFDIDDKALRKRHRELSKTLHPDRYAGRPAAERRLALNRAILVNDAFRALENPIKRAEALARRLGLPVGETSEPQPPPMLLMEIMEAREELAEAHTQKDRGRIAKLATAMQKRQDDTLARLTAAFSKAHENQQAKADVLPLIGELRYIRRYLDEAAGFEAHLDETL